ncbi:MAG: hypothetical protein V1839_00415 [archaeon]
MIGVLLVAATFLIIGAVGVLAPLVKSGELYAAYDITMTMNAALAAPYGVTVYAHIPNKFTAPEVRFNTLDRAVAVYSFLGAEIESQYIDDSSAKMIFENYTSYVFGTSGVYTYKFKNAEAVNGARFLSFEKRRTNGADNLIVRCVGCKTQAFSKV